MSRARTALTSVLVMLGACSPADQAQLEPVADGPGLFDDRAPPAAPVPGDGPEAAAVAGFLALDGFGPPLLPRGLDATHVEQALLELLEPGSPVESYARALELMRYYETRGLVPQLEALQAEVTGDGSDALQREAYLLQAIGELGDEPARQRAVARYGGLAERSASPVDVALLLQTAFSLTPDLPPDVPREMLEDGVERAHDARNRGEDGRRGYDELLALQRNDWPRVRAQMERKQALGRQAPDQRAGELVAIYLGRADLADEPLRIWAARTLRADAARDDCASACPALSAAIDAAGSDVELARGVQALEALGGSPTPDQAARYARLQSPVAGFLAPSP